MSYKIIWDLIHHNPYSKWQKGKVVPTVDHLVALSSLFEVAIDEIIIIEDTIVQ